MHRSVLAAALPLAAPVVLASSVALAGAPPAVDPAMSPWFEDLRQPGTNRSCCSIADCRPVDYRVVANHYEAFVGDHWVKVPPDKILHRFDNPTGRAVVCWTPAPGVMCFVQGPGA